MDNFSSRPHLLLFFCAAHNLETLRVYITWIARGRWQLPRTKIEGYNLMQEKKGRVNGKTTQKQSVTRENAEQGKKAQRGGKKSRMRE